MRHKWLTTYHTIYGGCGCPVCSGLVKKVEKDYHELAENRGFKWIDTILPENTHVRTLWECSKLHCWKTEYGNIKSGTGCPVCAIEALKHTKLEYCNIAEDRSIVWIGNKLPKNVNIKTKWKCLKCDYIWETAYATIYSGSGCPYCVKCSKKIEIDYHNLATKCGFEWVGKFLPKNTTTKTWWQCKEGHRWEARYNDIDNNHGCPRCKNIINGAPVSKPQIKLSNMLIGSLNYSESRYFIDIAIMRSSRKIAVEYDCWYWHRRKEKHDAERDRFLIFRGWKVLHIKSGRLLPTRKQLKTAINYLLKEDNKVCNLYLKDWKL